MQNTQSKGELVEFKTTSDRNKNAKAATTCYLTSAQRKYLIKTVGNTCFILFSFYMEKAGYPQGYDFNDSKVASILGYSERQVRNARWELTRIGWFAKSTFKNRAKVKVVITI